MGKQKNAEKNTYNLLRLKFRNLNLNLEMNLNSAQIYVDSSKVYLNLSTFLNLRNFKDLFLL